MWPELDRRLVTLSPADHRAIRDLQEAHHSTLANFRETAGKWQVGLAGLITGFSGLLVVTGRETFDKLNDQAKIWAGVWLAVAVACAVTGGVLGLLASAGWPKRFDLETALGADLQPGDIFLAINKWRESRYRRAHLSLVCGVATTSLAIVFLFLALAVTWYSPEMEEDDERPCVVITVGQAEVGRWEVGNSDLEIATSGEESVKLSLCPPSDK